MSEVAEVTELQDILAAASPAQGSGLRKSNSSPEGRYIEPSSIDHCQWEVRPNGVFFPTGRAEQTLPAGVYITDIDPHGKIFFSRKTVMTDSLIDLDSSNSIRVIEGIKLFWTREKHFKSKGVLYKRGVMLWGPPGSGKTATLSLLINELISQNGLVLLVQDPSISVRGITELRKIEPERRLIVVFEDIEEIVAKHGEHELLALLDGEHQTENVVNLATTNYPEQLGARIVNRPSRFDEVIKIGMPSDKMRRQYFDHVLKGIAVEPPVSKWVADTQGMSIAHLKEMVIAVTCLDQEYHDVLQRLKSMKTPPKSGSLDSVGFAG